MIDGFPSVRRFSSLLDYLKLCECGVLINSTTLDCQLFKKADGTWDGVDGSDPLTSLELLNTLREYIAEDSPDIDLDKACIIIEPVDKLAVKKEVADAADAALDAEPDEQVAMKLCNIELTDDGWVETATFDGGPPTAQPQQPQFEAYQLPLHLRLPRKKRRIIDDEEDSAPEPRGMRKSGAFTCYCAEHFDCAGAICNIGAHHRVTAWHCFTTCHCLTACHRVAACRRATACRHPRGLYARQGFPTQRGTQARSRVHQPCLKYFHPNRQPPRPWAAGRLLLQGPAETFWRLLC